VASLTTGRTGATVAAVVSSGHAVRDMPRVGGDEEEWTVGRASSAVTREVCGGGDLR